MSKVVSEHSNNKKVSNVNSKEAIAKSLATKRRNGTLNPSKETKQKISKAHLNLSKEKRENILYGQRNNRYNTDYAKKLSDTKLGVTNPQAKLTEEDVRYIRKLWATGSYSAQAISDKVQIKISRQAVSDIVHKRTWKHLIEDSNDEP